MRYLISTAILIIAAIFIFLIFRVNENHRLDEFLKHPIFSTSESVLFERRVIEKISKLSCLEPPPPVINFNVFVPGQNNRIVATHISDLKQLYFSVYKNRFQDFQDFLFDLFNQRMKLNADSVGIYLDTTFIPDTTISSVHQRSGVAELIACFTVKDYNRYRLKSNGLTWLQINSISYYFLSINSLGRMMIIVG